MLFELSPYHAHSDLISYAIKVLQNVEELSTCHEHILQSGRSDVTRFMLMSTIEVQKKLRVPPCIA